MVTHEIQKNIERIEREMYIFSIYRTGEDGIVKYDGGKNILFLIIFFLNRKTRDQSSIYDSLFFLSTDTQKNSISRSSSVFAANFTQYDDNPSKKKVN